MDVTPYILWHLDSDSKEFSDKCRLAECLTCVHSLHLFLPDQVQCFISLQCSPYRGKSTESHSWFDSPFEKPMVLFNPIVQVFDADVSSTDAGSIPLALSSAMALGEAAFLATLMTRGTDRRALGSSGAVSWVLFSSI